MKVITSITKFFSKKDKPKKKKEKPVSDFKKHENIMFDAATWDNQRHHQNFITNINTPPPNYLATSYH